jgi:hypothetical protein
MIMMRRGIYGAHGSIDSWAVPWQLGSSWRRTCPRSLPALADMTTSYTGCPAAIPDLISRRNGEFVS